MKKNLFIFYLLSLTIFSKGQNLNLDLLIEIAKEKYPSEKFDSNTLFILNGVPYVITDLNTELKKYVKSELDSIININRETININPSFIPRQNILIIKTKNQQRKRMRLFQKDGMKLENRNFRKAEKIYERKFKSNHNSFLLSFGTIGNKYVWSFTQDYCETYKIPIKGWTKRNKIRHDSNWENLKEKSPPEIDCYVELDGDILMHKMRIGDEIVEESFLYSYDCLKQVNDKYFKIIIDDYRKLFE